MKRQLTLLLVLLAGTVTAQQFKPDQFGHISDPKFAALIKHRGYSMVGFMDSVRLLNGRRAGPMVARVMKDNKQIFVDWNGNEYPDEQAVFRAAGSTEIEMMLIEPTNPLAVGDDDAAIHAVHRAVDPPYLDPEKYHGFKINEKEGYIIGSDTVIPAQYDMINEFFDEKGNLLLKVTLGNLEGICSSKGKVMVPVAYNDIKLVKDGGPERMFYATLNRKTGVLSASGEVVVPIEYPALEWVDNEGLFKIVKGTRSNRQYGAIDRNGRLITMPLYTSVTRPVKKSTCIFVYVTNRLNERRFGILDNSGTMILDTIYGYYEFFAGNVVEVKKEVNGQWLSGLVDLEKGKVTVPCTYKLIYLMHSDWKIIQQATEDGSGAYGLVDSSGQLVVEAVWDALDYIPVDRELILKKNGKYGITDLKFNPILPFTYDYLSSPRDQGRDGYLYPKGTYIFSKDNRLGMINVHGEVLIPCEYTELQATPFGIVGSLGNSFRIFDLNHQPLIAEQAGRFQEMRDGVIWYRTPEGQRVQMDFYGNSITR